MMFLTGKVLCRALFSCGLFCSVAAAETCPVEVRLGFPDFEVIPFIYGKDDLDPLRGVLVEWTQNALARTGCTPDVSVHRRPAKRQMAEVRSGLVDIMPGVGYTAENRDYMAFPVRNDVLNPSLVTIRDQVSLYVRSDDQSVKWDGGNLQSVNPRIGISAGVVLSEVVAESRGWQVDVAKDPPGNIKKLKAKRIDAILEPDLLLAHYLKKRDAKGIRKLTPPVLVVDRYAPVSKQFQEKYPEFTRRFWLEICKESRVMFPSLPSCQS